MRAISTRRLAGCALALALGCGSGAESDAPRGLAATTIPPRDVPEVVTTSSTLAPSRPPGSPDAARRALEERGVDPDHLSEEVGEHMRRRLR